MKLLSLEEFLSISETNITSFGQDHINGFGGSYDKNLRNEDDYMISNEYKVFLRDFKEGKYLKTTKECQEERKLRLRAKRRKL